MTYERARIEEAPSNRIVRMRVTVANEILGNSEHIMTIDKIKKFNKCAYICAKKVQKYGGKHSMGMWTVEAA
ncbi:MAG: hypothetical protein DRI61_16965 [Chloroflexi bacterium]|nr:MAG: hypothetical protein DRI61_16965 [Chloroflexota bacterium]